MNPILALLAGYGSGAAYFTVCMVLHGERLSRDYWVVLTWVAIFTFTIGAAIFLPAYFLIEKRYAFWLPWICGPIGAAIGFFILYFIYPELARHHFYGGQAAIIAAVTFITAGLLKRKGRTR